MVSLRSWLLAAAATSCVADPPNTSLATIPVAYYGAAWNRSDANLEMLSRQRIVVLMQEDGGCWLKCCPDVDTQTYTGLCQHRSSIDTPYNASLNPGCDPSCDQHGKQEAVFKLVKAVATASGRSGPHAMVYMNAVYDWPFDGAHAAGALEVDVLDVNGKPHAEVCDPGIYPSYILDYGRAAGRRAFADEIRRHVAYGVADGVFLDNFGQIPMRCDKGSGNCTVVRNQRISKANVPSIVTEDQVEAYTAGKNESLTTAGDIIRSHKQGAFAAFTYGLKPNPNGANMAVLNVHKTDADDLIQRVNESFQNGYDYLLVLFHAFRSPTVAGDDDPDMVNSRCSEYEVATFLLAVEEGVFMACNGWSDEFERPLGNPMGPAETTGGIMHRSFESGVEVQWRVGTENATIIWPTARSRVMV